MDECVSTTVAYSDELSPSSESNVSVFTFAFTVSSRWWSFCLRALRVLSRRGVLSTHRPLFGLIIGFVNVVQFISRIKKIMANPIGGERQMDGVGKRVASFGGVSTLAVTVSHGD